MTRVNMSRTGPTRKLLVIVKSRRKSKIKPLDFDCYLKGKKFPYSYTTALVLFITRGSFNL